MGKQLNMYVFDSNAMQSSGEPCYFLREVAIKLKVHENANVISTHHMLFFEDSALAESLIFFLNEMFLGKL